MLAGERPLPLNGATLPACACSQTVQQSRGWSPGSQTLTCATAPLGTRVSGTQEPGPLCQAGSAVTIFQNKRTLKTTRCESPLPPTQSSRFFRSHLVPAEAPQAVPALFFFLEMEQLLTVPTLENTWKRGNRCRRRSRLILHPPQAGP